MPETHRELIEKAKQLGVSLDEMGDSAGNISIPILQERVRAAQDLRHSKRNNRITVAALIVAVVAVIVAVTGWQLRTTWQGVYYPDGCLVCEDQYIYSPIYHSKEDCFAWANTLKQSRGNNVSDDWECGKNCKTKDNGTMVCKETRDN